MFIPPSFQPGALDPQRFRDIVGKAREGNPFYARWLADPDDIPVLPRSMFQRHNDEILNGREATTTTSGSLGMPIRLANSHDRQWLNRRDVLRYIQWVGGPLQTTNLVDTGSHRPDHTVMAVTAPADEQLRFILRRYREEEAVEFVTYPSNGERLAQRILERGIDMSFILRIGLIAETFDPYQERLVRQAFPNAFVWTTYSSMEFGLIAARCPLEPGYFHIMSHKLGVEVLRDDGSSCEEGEMGRVIITDYHNELTPFIRYEIGDYAIPGRCPCGRIELPSFSRVVGKTRGTLLHRSGEREPFVGLSTAIRDIPGITQFQVIQETVDEFTIHVVTDRSVEADLARVFDAHFGYQTTMRVNYEQQILPDKNGKFHTLISKV